MKVGVAEAVELAELQVASVVVAIEAVRGVEVDAATTIPPEAVAAAWADVTELTKSEESFTLRTLKLTLLPPVEQRNRTRSATDTREGGKKAPGAIWERAGFGLTEILWETRADDLAFLVVNLEGGGRDSIAASAVVALADDGKLIVALSAVIRTETVGVVDVGGHVLEVGNIGIAAHGGIECRCTHEGRHCQRQCGENLRCIHV